MKTEFRDFDLPTGHVADLNLFWIMPRAHGEAEIARRQGRPRGVLRAEMQFLGAVAGRQMFHAVEGDDRIELAQWLAPAYLGSAALSYRGTSNTMRSRLKIPIMAISESEFQAEWRSDEATATQDTMQQLDSVVVVANDLVVHTANNDRRRFQTARSVGRAAGDAGLKLACLGMADMAVNFTAAEAQEVARNECLAAMDRLRQLGEQIGAYPTLAQLAYPTSPLAVHIANNAPTPVYNALQTSLAECAIAA